MPSVLLIAADEKLTRELEPAMRRSGLRISIVRDGDAALAAIRRDAPDVVVFDLAASGADGVRLSGEIRRRSGVPLILLAPTADPIETVIGLESGADDYLAKPFEARVLAARIRAVLRRSRPDAETTELRLSDIEIDLAAKRVRRGDSEVSLTTHEFALLVALARARGAVLTRAELLERAWDYQWEGDTRLVDMHVARLRQKLGRDVIETVRGAGYRSSRS